MISSRPRHKLRIINIGLLSLTLGLIGFGLWSYVLLPILDSSLSLSQTYPTLIPWLQDQATCEKTDRAWHDEQCWDYQHNPNF